MQVFFEKIREEISQRIEAARQSIDVAMAWFTDTELWERLCAAQKRGVKVRLLVAADPMNNQIQFEALNKLGGQAYLKDMSEISTYSKMHNKFCVIDQKILITGSYNWTNQAPYNAENILVISNASLAQDYAAQFDRLLSGLINLQHVNTDSLAFPNAYGAKITRKEPTAVLILLDQSGSMSGGEVVYEGRKINKAQAAAGFVNQILNELIMKCTKDDGLRDYVQVGILGYGAQVGGAWQTGQNNQVWRSIQELAQSATTETSLRTKVVRGKNIEVQEYVQTWIQPKANGGTPMGQALKLSLDLLKTWVEKYPDSFPPIIINISDGDSTDLKGTALIEIANKVKSLHTKNGRCLIFNCHVGEDGPLCKYPRNQTDLPKSNSSSIQLFEMSSLLPAVFYPVCQGDIPHFSPQERYYAMFQNAPITEMLRILQIGTSHI